jgi:two-component system nitrogen regulation response regulator GlnG
LVCDDEASLREMLQILLRREGYEVDVVDGVHAAREQLGSADPYDAVITDLVMPDGTGMEVLDAVSARSNETQTLMITAYATTEQAVNAMKRGAYDYVQKPFKNHELLATLEKALEKRAIVAENATLREQVKSRWTEGQLIGKSAAMDRLRDLVKRVADSTTSVLITGESGTGKEMVARSLHFQSPRADAPFVVLNCGAVPENLIESELFGHVKGAFTGATSAKEGLFRQADGGTLFLDEVGELPPALQVKLLRVLQDRQVRPVGGSSEVEVDVRVLAATNRDVEAEVKAGNFREDLFYRLNVVPMRLPPLRERLDDIGDLARHFLRITARENLGQHTISTDAIERLKHYDWPGNVRELENLIRRIVAVHPQEVITPELIDQELADAVHAPPSAEAPSDDLSLSEMVERYLAHYFAGFGNELPPPGLHERVIREVEAPLISAALAATRGNQIRAAELLGLNRNTLRSRVKSLNIQIFKTPQT